jgi:hypothetical protein
MSRMLVSGGTRIQSRRLWSCKWICILCCAGHDLSILIVKCMLPIYSLSNYIITLSTMYILLPLQPSFHPIKIVPSQTLTIIPLGQLHRPMIIQMLVHIKAIPQQMRLMSPPLPQTLKLGFIKIILQDRHILRVRTFLNDDSCALARREAAHVREPLLRDDDVEVVFGLVDVCAHRDDAADACWVSFGGTCRGRVHYAVFGRSQEIGTSA